MKRLQAHVALVQSRGVGDMDDELQQKAAAVGPPPEWDIRYWDLFAGYSDRS